MNRRHSVESVLQVLAAGLLAIAVSAGPASASAKYAAMVVDGHSGKMLYGENVDSPRYPASITKVMTLYIVFEELRAGRLTKSTQMKVSRHASGQAPSRLGLKPGETISVDNAIRALVTKSANDVAMVVAEHIGGSQTGFATRMTETARRLGMAHTTYRNPHGLPDSAQKTTARDLITLSRRIQNDFPAHYGYFATQSFTWRGRTYRNYNKLLGNFKGTTGIKTGYIRASGYNLTASVDRGDKRVVAVVLGGKTGRSRDAHMRKIIERAFPKAVAFKGAPSIDAPPPAAKPVLTASVDAVDAPPTAAAPPQKLADLVLKPTPARQPVAARTGVVVLNPARLAPRNRELPLAEPVSRPTSGRFAVAGVQPASRRPMRVVRVPAVMVPPMAAAGYAPAESDSGLSSIGALIRSSTADAPAPAEPHRRPARLILPPSSTVDPKGPAAPAEQAAKTAPAAAPLKAAVDIPDGYQIQVGAYARKNDAEDRIEDARKAAARPLSEAMGIAVEAENGKGRFYRARFAGLARGDADRACQALKRRRIDCIVVAQ